MLTEFFSAYFRDRIFFQANLQTEMYFPPKTIAPLQVKWMFPKPLLSIARSSLSFAQGPYILWMSPTPFRNGDIPEDSCFFPLMKSYFSVLLCLWANGVLHIIVTLYVPSWCHLGTYLLAHSLEFL